MELWRKVWQKGVAPNLSTKGLLALRNAIEVDDPALVQGATTCPPPQQCVLDWPAEACCVIGYAAWKGDGKETVGEVEETFARTCFEVDQLMGQPAAVRFFLNWYDESPRDQMRLELFQEVKKELGRRNVS